MIAMDQQCGCYMEESCACCMEHLTRATLGVALFGHDISDYSSSEYYLLVVTITDS